MTRQAFDRSLREGAHRSLAAMAGEWSGTFRLWFEADAPPACEAPQCGTLRSVLGGRFLLHEYTTRFQDEPIEGIALYGYHLSEDAWETAWAESFGTGTQLMFCTGPGTDASLSVLGRYRENGDAPYWGWRTEIEQPSEDRLRIVMTNISPQGEAVRAVETDYRRVG